MADTLECTQPKLRIVEPQAGQTLRTGPPKAQLVKKLLRRGKGATSTELQNATAWQPHTVRAFLSSLRKKGEVLVKEARKSGETAYRIAGAEIVAERSDA